MYLPFFYPCLCCGSFFSVQYWHMVYYLPKITHWVMQIMSCHIKTSNMYLYVSSPDRQLIHLLTFEIFYSSSKLQCIFETSPHLSGGQDFGSCFHHYSLSYFSWDTGVLINWCWEPDELGLDLSRAQLCHNSSPERWIALVNFNL